MKILILSDANNIHTIRWVSSLADRGIEILLFSLPTCTVDAYDVFTNVMVVGCQKGMSKTAGIVVKLKYLTVLSVLKKEIKKFNPDIVHAHYATSYGLLGALSGFSPFVLSVWGSDVFEFPVKSFLHKKILEFNLSRTDKILSTSNVMAVETNKYSNKNIEITPFGIDLNIFKKKKVERLFSENAIVIGTVKSLEKIYGIRYLIKGFILLVEKYPELPLKLLIVGRGTQEQKLKSMCKKANILDKTIFTGHIKHKEVPRYLNMLDVSVSVSDNESFGVAVIEASACCCPVIVSNVGGLPEVVADGVTGIVVPRRDEKGLMLALEKLIFDAGLRKKMGLAGRKKVALDYDWDKNVTQMHTIYKKLLKK